MIAPSPSPSGDSPAPPAAAPASRLLRSVVIAVLALALSFLSLLNVVTSAPIIRDSLGPLVWEHRVVSGAAIFLTLGFALIVPAVVLIVLSRRGWLRGPQLTALAVLVAASFVYLGWDDAGVRRPLTMDELSPALPGDEASFNVVLRFSKNSPAANAVKTPKLLIGVATGDLVSKPEKWAQFVRDHRAEIGAEWAALAPVCAWWDELAAFPRIGDLTPPSISSPILAFQPVRSYSQFAVGIASLQALDGHGDEAMATVIRLFDVARKLEPNSRTLVRAMIAKVIQKMAVQAAGFVLDHATVSPASRAALAAELRAATEGPPGARRLILIEYAYFQPTFSLFLGGAPVVETPSERAFQNVIRFFGRLVINSNATLNLVGDRYYQLATLAEARRLGELEANKGPIDREFIGGYHAKNLGGRLFADMAMPALSKVVKSYWDIEDLRVALLARLTT